MVQIVFQLTSQLKLAAKGCVADPLAGRSGGLGGEISPQQAERRVLNVALLAIWFVT